MLSSLSAQEKKAEKEIDPEQLKKTDSILQVIDTARTYVGAEEDGKTEKFQKDTILETINDVSPLDIGSNRGIFILSANKLLQLRIIGSVRSHFNYSSQDLESKESLNPYDVPTAERSGAPNYYAGVGQTRLGFEITRRTENLGDIFFRIESDFLGKNGAFRIRHAYGEIGRFLVGQTWSLVNNVGYQPLIVSFDGVAGGIGLRTPQIRYTHRPSDTFTYSVAIEYSQPQVRIPEAIEANIIQVIPDLTGRFSYFSDKFSFRVSGAITTISGKVDDNDIVSTLGYLLSFAGKANVVENGDLYLSLTMGSATAHFVDVFNGKDEDLYFDSVELRFKPNNLFGGYVAYNHKIKQSIYANASFGIAGLQEDDNKNPNAYDWGFNALFNVFWEPAEGARLGIEFAHGERHDLSSANGNANRLSLLMYYDF